jgi:putative membrane protein
MESARLFFIGIILGIANVIPGVSGGTMAVVFGLYDRLVGVLSLNFARIKANAKFLAFLGAGLVVSILVFARVVTFLLDHYPCPSISFLRASSWKYSLYRRACGALARRAWAQRLVQDTSVALAVVGALIMVVMFSTTADKDGSPRITEFSTPVAIWLFAMGIVSAITMLMPGISGSFMLVLLGAYGTVMGSVSDFNVPLMAPFALGVGVGLLAGAFIMRTLIARFPYPSYGFILGLVAGSVLPIFPGLPSGVMGMALCAASLVAGFAISYAFAKGDKERSK